MAKIPTAPKFDAQRMYFNILDDYANPSITLPPLYLQVNPSSIKYSYIKKIHRYQTFAAYVEEYHGEELDTISCEASTGAFITPEDGLTNLFKTSSQAHYNYSDLVELYRNNGCVYDDYGRVIRKGLVLLVYDENSYLGQFDEFDTTESSDSPFRNTFTFTYKILKTYVSI